MARLYADEDFPFPVVDRLRQLGHDVVTAFEAGQANQGIADADQLAFATSLGRAILTRNRKDYVPLHRVVTVRRLHRLTQISEFKSALIGVICGSIPVERGYLMAALWYAWHAGKVLGPVPADELQRLAATGVLLPSDLLWPQSGDPREAIELQGALDFAKLPPRVRAPAWLSDVRHALQAPAPKPSAVPDWLADVEKATPSKVPASSPAPAAARPPAKLQRLVPAPPPQGLPHLLIGGASSVGRVRERNEDRFAIQQWTWNNGKQTHETVIIVVADGMGGYEGGDQASALTVRVVAEKLGALPLQGGESIPPAGLAAAVAQAFQDANRVVLQMAQSNARLKDMGATAAVVLIWDGQAIITHVGDCRVYLERAGELKQLTEDQTLVARMVKLGQLSPAEAAAHPNRNEVTQAVGKRAVMEPSHLEEPLFPDDRLIVACDGLIAHVDDTALRRALGESQLAPQQLATHLVNLADAGGGTDNCTVVVALFA